MVPKGHPDAQPIDELTPIDNEIVLPKTSSGVFNSTVIDYVLRNMGIARLIVAGVVTDQCVDMAVRDAADKGYLVSLPEDACATYSPERHSGALKAFGGYCWVTDTDTVVALASKAREAEHDLADGHAGHAGHHGLRRNCPWTGAAQFGLQGQRADSTGWVPANMSLTPFDEIASPNPWGSSGDLRLLADPAARFRVAMPGACVAA